MWDFFKSSSQSCCVKYTMGFYIKLNSFISKYFNVSFVSQFFSLVLRPS